MQSSITTTSNSARRIIVIKVTIDVDPFGYEKPSPAQESQIHGCIERAFAVLLDDIVDEVYGEAGVEEKTQYNMEEYI